MKIMNEKFRECKYILTFASILPVFLLALFTHVSTESREYEEMMTILTSSYIETGSAGCFAYCDPRLVHSELLEKEVRDRWTGGVAFPFKCVMLLYDYLWVK